MAQPSANEDPFGLAGKMLDERFRIDREIAEGGFGVVYFANQVALDRPVAIKVLKTPAGFDAAAKKQFQEKFASEAKTIARLRHPHIVDVYDFGMWKGPDGELSPWMALEWLEGQTLEQQLRQRRGQGGRAPAEILTMFRPVLEAFAYAHRQGIVHRDIKPANIMAVPADRGSLLRVLDFGIAKLVHPDETAGTGHTKTSGIPAFSPLYAAPEQIAYGRTGPWTDVHALGLILCELLTDSAPYRANDVQLFEEIMSAERPTPAARGVDVGPWEAILRKAVSLSPGERWKNAAELLTALENPAALPRARAAAPLASRETVPAPSTRAAAPAHQSATAVEIEGMRATSRSGKRWLAGVGAVVVAGGILAVVASRGGETQRHEATPVEATGAGSQTAPSPKAGVVPAQVTATPAGTEVSADGSARAAVAPPAPSVPPPPPTPRPTIQTKPKTHTKHHRDGAKPPAPGEIDIE